MDCWGANITREVAKSELLAVDNSLDVDGAMMKL